MGSSELKTDASQRWMMYSKDAYEGGRIFLTAEQKLAVDEGKRFSQRAYAEVWARDAALVQRVRTFLADNFHWHGRLSQRGADLEVVQTLQSMIRGESVVLIAERSRFGGSVESPTPAEPKMRGFRETLMTSYGMTYEAASDYMDWYDAMVDRSREVAARYANGAASSLVDDTSNLTERSTPLGDAQLFQYTVDVGSGEIEELAASTNNRKFAAKMLGYDQKTFGDILHNFKPDNGLGPANNVIWHDNGDVYFKGNFVGNFHDWAN